MFVGGIYVDLFGGLQFSVLLVFFSLGFNLFGVFRFTRVSLVWLWVLVVLEFVC